MRDLTSPVIINEQTDLVEAMVRLVSNGTSTGAMVVPSSMFNQHALGVFIQRYLNQDQLVAKLRDYAGEVGAEYECIDSVTGIVANYIVGKRVDGSPIYDWDVPEDMLIQRYSGEQFAIEVTRCALDMIWFPSSTETIDFAMLVQFGETLFKVPVVVFLEEPAPLLENEGVKRVMAHQWQARNQTAVIFSKSETLTVGPHRTCSMGINTSLYEFIN